MRSVKVSREQIDANRLQILKDAGLLEKNDTGVTEYKFTEKMFFNGMVVRPGDSLIYYFGRFAAKLRNERIIKRGVSFLDCLHAFYWINHTPRVSANSGDKVRFVSGETITDVDMKWKIE